MVTVQHPTTGEVGPEEGHNEPVRARVIVLAGPSGAGKSRLAERLGPPVLRLDDFYKDGDDPTLPRIAEGANAGLVDWDHPDSWLPDDALAAIERLCRDGSAEVPVYDIAHDGRTGHRLLDLEGQPFFVAEGIFAQEIVPACQGAGLLAAAYCVRQHPVVTFWRRLTRDLREHRKPPARPPSAAGWRCPRPAPRRRARRGARLRAGATPDRGVPRGVGAGQPELGRRLTRPAPGSCSCSPTSVPAARRRWSWPASLRRPGYRNCSSAAA